MIERYIAPALTFTVLIGGHIAIVMAMFASPAPQATVQAQRPPASTPVTQLETVVVTGKRLQPAPQVVSTEKSTLAPASRPAEGRGVLLRRAAD
jgi:hypothetical protein